MPKLFGPLLSGHVVLHTTDLGWGGLRNGQLLNAAESEHIEAIVTVDKGMPHQQNIAARSLAVVVILSRSNDLATLAARADEVLCALATLRPGEVRYVPARNQTADSA
jgi:hypothetical protein